MANRVTTVRVHDVDIEIVEREPIWFLGPSSRQAALAAEVNSVLLLQSTLPVDANVFNTYKNSGIDKIRILIDDNPNRNILLVGTTLVYEGGEYVPTIRMSAAIFERASAGLGSIERHAFPTMDGGLTANSVYRFLGDEKGNIVFDVARLKRYVPGTAAQQIAEWGSIAISNEYMLYTNEEPRWLPPLETEFDFSYYKQFHDNVRTNVSPVPGSQLYSLTHGGVDFMTSPEVITTTAGPFEVAGTNWADALAEYMGLPSEELALTRYGFLEGVVEQVSPDAIADEARGLVFPARVRITKSRLRLDGRTTGEDPAGLLSPGMAAQVEIVTGRRSVISYVLSPIAKATGEAGRER